MVAETTRAHEKAVRGDFRNPAIKLYPESRNAVSVLE